MLCCRPKKTAATTMSPTLRRGKRRRTRVTKKGWRRGDCCAALPAPRRRCTRARKCGMHRARLWPRPQRSPSHAARQRDWLPSCCPAAPLAVSMLMAVRWSGPVSTCTMPTRGSLRGSARATAQRGCISRSQAVNARTHSDAESDHLARAGVLQPRGGGQERHDGARRGAGLCCSAVRAIDATTFAHACTHECLHCTGKKSS